jgi:hypothetical protein
MSSHGAESFLRLTIGVRLGGDRATSKKARPEIRVAAAGRSRGGCDRLRHLAGVAIADEGGTSFWAPGTFASFSAIPRQPPRWSLAIVDY